MKRKEFLFKSTLAAFAISTFGKVVKQEQDVFMGDCETTNDILGPFYRSDAPVRDDLVTKGLVGTIITLKGKVFGNDCSTPLENALVEIWHCNTEGDYDNDSSKFHQRAKWYTNELGEYQFRTILPGKYLNGSRYRPAHIHFRVTANGSKELISQIYFQGDPHIEKDHWASQKKAEKRILPIVLEDTKGNLVVNFDISLAQKEN